MLPLQPVTAANAVTKAPILSACEHLESDGIPSISPCTVHPCRMRLCSLCRMAVTCRTEPILRADFPPQAVAFRPSLLHFGVIAATCPLTRSISGLGWPRADRRWEVQPSVPASAVQDSPLLRTVAGSGSVAIEKPQLLTQPPQPVTSHASPTIDPTGSPFTRLLANQPIFPPRTCDRQLSLRGGSIRQWGECGKVKNAAPPQARKPAADVVWGVPSSPNGRQGSREVP